MQAAFALAAAALLAVAGAARAASPAADAEPPLPQRLSETGLYAPGAARTVRAGNIAFSPQYPLWSDGATKRRWISLPAGTSIDASRPDAWEFPVGTRLWKEFGVGRAVETRYIERLADGSWRFAAYVWNADGSDAELAPSGGTVVAVAGAPGGRYAIPSRTDCLACHDGGSGPVLGFSALQLSPDRDPLAVHADAKATEFAELQTLAARGVVRNLPQALIDEAPRIAADSPTARAALGYLHGNCGHCHNDRGALASLDLSLQQQVAAPADSVARTMASLLGRSSRFRPHRSGPSTRVVAGAGENSVLAVRMKTANPMARMPPLGVRVADREGITLIERWITQHLPRPLEQP